MCVYVCIYAWRIYILSAVESAECKIKGVDMVFVMDESGSITRRNFELMKDLALDIVDAFEIGPDLTRVGWINFESFAYVVFNLGKHQNKMSLKDRIRLIPYDGGGTNISAGLVALHNSLSHYGRNRFDIPELAIVVTDGQSSIRYIQNAAAGIRMERNVDVYAIGVGTGIEFDQLHAVAAAGIEPNTSRNVFILEDFDTDELNRLRETLTRRACFSKLLSWPIYAYIYNL